MVNEVREEFLQKNANLLALTKNGANDVMRRVASSMDLDETARGDVLFHMDTIDQKRDCWKDRPGFFQGRDVQTNMSGLSSCSANYRIEFVAKLTPEAIQELEAIEVAAGERELAPPPPPHKSAREQLEDQVREDWVKLETSKFRARMQRDPAYREVAERLLAGDDLRTQATTMREETTKC